jgi:hypothetical protein
MPRPSEDWLREYKAASTPASILVSIVIICRRWALHPRSSLRLIRPASRRVDALKPGFVGDAGERWSERYCRINFANGPETAVVLRKLSFDAME